MFKHTRTRIMENTPGERNNIFTISCVNGKKQIFITVMNRNDESAQKNQTTKQVEALCEVLDAMTGANRSFIPDADQAVTFAQNVGLTLHNSSIGSPSVVVYNDVTPYTDNKQSIKPDEVRYFKHGSEYTAGGTCITPPRVGQFNFV